MGEAEARVSNRAVGKADGPIGRPHPGGRLRVAPASRTGCTMQQWRVCAPHDEEQAPTLRRSFLLEVAGAEGGAPPAPRRPPGTVCPTEGAEGARARAGGLASFIACARDDSDDDGTLQPSSNMTQYIVCPEDRAAPSGDAVPPNSAPTSWRVPLYTAPICIWSRTHYRRGGPLADVGMDRRY